MSEYDIRAVTATAARDLRRAVLHCTADRVDRSAQGDESPTTLHVGGYRGERLAGVATATRARMPGESEPDAWRIHGIAVDYGHRGWGLGGRLLERCLEHAAVQTARLAWCDSPAGTFGFFENFGFHRVGDPFTVDDVPHYRLVVRFRAAPSTPALRIESRRGGSADQGISSSRA